MPKHNVIPFPSHRFNPHQSNQSSPFGFPAPSSGIQALSPSWDDYIKALLILSGSPSLRALFVKTQPIVDCTILESAAIQFGSAFNIN